MAVSFNGKHLAKFIRPEEYEAIYPQVELAHNQLESKTGAGNDFLGWLDLPVTYDKEEFARIKEAAQKIRSDSDVLLVAGIGGSYLGARAVVEAVKGLYHNEADDGLKIYFCGNTISPTALNDIIKLTKGKRFSINVISKSGTTGKAGVCISASAERDGLRLIAVVLGSASGKERFQAASTLLDYGFAHYESAAAALPGDAPQTLPVEHGTAATVPLNYESPGHCLMPKGEGGTLEVVVELPASLSAPVAAGEQVGRIKILHQGTEMCSYPITAAQNVDALSFRYCLRLLAQSLLLRN